MTSILAKLLLKLGLVEEVNHAPIAVEPVEQDDDELVVLPGETFQGGIETHRNVEVRGHVNGNIYTPNGRVLLAPEGSISGGTICAREVIWKGAMGASTVHCSHIAIVAGAQSIQGMSAPHLFHESMNIGKIGGLDVAFDRQSYLPTRPVDMAANTESLLQKTEQSFLNAA
jgi:cytoskeletal protein CcmA (bactofilin family)